MDALWKYYYKLGLSPTERTATTETEGHCILHIIDEHVRLDVYLECVNDDKVPCCYKHRATIGSLYASSAALGYSREYLDTAASAMAFWAVMYVMADDISHGDDNKLCEEAQELGWIVCQNERGETYFRHNTYDLFVPSKKYSLEQMRKEGKLEFPHWGLVHVTRMDSLSQFEEKLSKRLDSVNQGKIYFDFSDT